MLSAVDISRISVHPRLIITSNKWPLKSAGINKRLPSISNADKIRTYKLVRKCVNDDICEILKDHFIINEIMAKGQETKITVFQCQKPRPNMPANNFTILDQRNIINFL